VTDVNLPQPESVPSQSPAAYSGKPYFALRLLLILTVTVLVGRFCVGLLLKTLPPEPLYSHSLVDSVVTALLVVPILYLFSFRPLSQHVRLLERMDKALRKAHSELEQRVQERTADLAHTNESLVAEAAMRRQAEELVQWQSKALLAAADGIIITDQAGVIHWCNPAVTRMTGYPTAELIGSTPRRLKSGHHSPGYYQELWGTILSGGVWQGETVNRRKDGTVYFEEQSITPVLDEAGRISRFIAIKHDITQRKEAEEHLKQRNWELGALNAIGSSISRELQLEERLATLKRLLSQELGFPGGAIFLSDPDMGSQESARLSLEEHWGLPEPPPKQWLASPQESGCHGRVIREKRPVLVPSPGFGAEPAFQQLAESRPDWRGCLIIPLLARDEVQGMIDLFFTDPIEQMEKRLGFFDTVGSQAGMAVYSAQLYKAEKQARQMAETLRNASQTLTQSLELDTVLETLLNTLCKLIPCDGATIYLVVDESRLAVRAVHAEGCDSAASQPHPVPFQVREYPALGAVLRSQESLLIDDTQAAADWRPIFGKAGTRTWLGVPISAGDRLIGICGMEHREPRKLTHEDLALAEAVAGQAAVAVYNAWLFEQVRVSRTRLQILSRRLVEIQETERRYIARELHDETSQALIYLVFALDNIKRDADKPEAVIAGVSEVNRIIDEVLENLHRLAVDLRPASLDHLGLVPALRQFTEGVIQKHGLAVHLDIVNLEGRLPQNMETSFYRIIQEGLSNVVRHAKATQADIHIEQRQGKVLARIVDNGIGFNPETALEKERLGLLGMRERAEMLGGSLIVESSDGCGTQISVEVPYADPNSHRG